MAIIRIAQDFLTSPGLWVAIGICLGVWVLMILLFWLIDFLFHRNAVVEAHIATLVGWITGGGGGIYGFIWWMSSHDSTFEITAQTWWWIWGIYSIILLFMIFNLLRVLAYIRTRFQSLMN